MESDPDHFAKNEVDTFIPYDMSDHSHDDDHCKNIINLLKERHIQVDGCTSFWEDCVVLASLIGEELELVGNPPEAVRTAKMKSRTQQVSPWPLLHSVETSLSQYECEWHCE